MKFKRFRVQNYRNILDSDWIDLCDVTAFVGQNEAGKSNLFEALYCLNPFVDGVGYDPDEDWPVDRWEEKKSASYKMVCEAEFELSESDIEHLYNYAYVEADEEEDEEDEGEDKIETHSEILKFPESGVLALSRRYGYSTNFSAPEFEDDLDSEKVTEWAKSNVPKFVYVHDYEMSGNSVELNELRARWDKVGRDNRHELSHEDQTILVILDLAQVDLDDLLEKGDTAEGRTIRSYDKRSASRYLTNQFRQLWTQKEVEFELEIDGPTLNIFAIDKDVGMPVRLHRRSTGFRWHVSFAWKFTHASDGEFEDCILLLEEPGIHLHYNGQRDLLRLFNKLAGDNTILYTTHLASMIDLENPERVRIVETLDSHLSVRHGVVSGQAAPMAVIEASLGLTADLSGMLGNRKVLIVEGATDALIINKLSGLLRNSGSEGLSDQVYLWPAESSSKTPMYSAFAVGQKWDAAVLLDTDTAGNDAKRKIDEMLTRTHAEEGDVTFQVLMLKNVAGIRKTDAAIEDLFPDSFFIGIVNKAYGLNISADDLPQDGSDMITKKVACQSA